MATVVQKSDTTRQAVLQVDEDGYLLVTGAGGSGGTTIITKEVIKERIVTLPVVERVEIIKEVIKEVPVPQIVEVIKEVPVEKRIEIIREVEGPERIVYRDKLVEVVKEVVKTEVKEIIKEKPVYPTEEELDRLLAEREAKRQEAIRAAEEEARRLAEEEAKKQPQGIGVLGMRIEGVTGASYPTLYRNNRLSALNGGYEKILVTTPREGVVQSDNNDIIVSEPVPYMEIKVTLTPRANQSQFPGVGYRPNYYTAYGARAPEYSTMARQNTPWVGFPEVTNLWRKDTGQSGFLINTSTTALKDARESGPWTLPTKETNDVWVAGHTYTVATRLRNVPANQPVWWWGAMALDTTKGMGKMDIQVEVRAFDKEPQ